MEEKTERGAAATATKSATPAVHGGGGRGGSRRRLAPGRSSISLCPRCSPRRSPAGQACAARVAGRRKARASARGSRTGSPLPLPHGGRPPVATNQGWKTAARTSLLPHPTAPTRRVRLVLGLGGRTENRSSNAARRRAPIPVPTHQVRWNWGAGWDPGHARLLESGTRARAPAAPPWRLLRARERGRSWRR